jgi:hypothetical protein
VESSNDDESDICFFPFAFYKKKMNKTKYSEPFRIYPNRRRIPFSIVQKKYSEPFRIYSNRRRIPFSIVQKKYSASKQQKKQKKMRSPGIEPGPPAWKADIMPLN